MSLTRKIISMTKDHSCSVTNCDLNGCTEACYVNILTCLQGMRERAQWSRCSNGLLKSDEIVITDKDILISVSYPMEKTVQFSVTSVEGFTRRSIIEHVCEIYEFVYKKEERTATTHTYHYSEQCSCTYELQNFCLLCKFSFNWDEPWVTLSCSHAFHNACIDKWAYDNNGYECPTCIGAAPIESLCGLCCCGIVEMEFTGSVIPKRLRQNIQYGDCDRAPTDGEFKICGCDLEKLHIVQLSYEEENKMLTFCICTTY